MRFNKLDLNLLVVLDALLTTRSVSKAAEVEALAAATLAEFGTPSFVFNNAGVGAGGLIWEHTQKDWEWVIGVNLMGVAHGVRVFTPSGQAIAHIHLPERCANVCFGGRHRNRLFMAASHSLYALYVNTQGAIGG